MNKTIIPTKEQHKLLVKMEYWACDSMHQYDFNFIKNRILKNCYPDADRKRLNQLRELYLSDFAISDYNIAPHLLKLYGWETRYRLYNELLDNGGISSTTKPCRTIAVTNIVA